jgi:hypothetical protein
MLALAAFAVLVMDQRDALPLSAKLDPFGQK